MRDDSEDHDVGDILEKFERLMDDLIHRQLRRACFRPWEIVLLVDIATSGAPIAALKRYRVVVREQLRNGARFPMKFSEYWRTQSDLP